MSAVATTNETVVTGSEVVSAADETAVNAGAATVESTAQGEQLPNPDITNLPGEKAEAKPYQERLLSIEQITLDKDLQARIRIDKDHVERLREPVRRGQKRHGDPVVVFHFFKDEPIGKKDKEGKEITEKTEKYVLADGFHWLYAHIAEDKKRIHVQIREGDETDALKYALGANSLHGLPLTTLDKERAITLALKNEKLSRLSTKAIARLCHVSEGLTKRVRDDYEKLVGAEAGKRVGADGKLRAASTPVSQTRKAEKEVRDSAQSLAKAKTPDKVKPAPIAGKTKPKGRTDIVGREIEERHAHIFASNVQIDAIVHILKNVEAQIASLRQNGSLVYAPSTVESNLKTLLADLHAAKPAYICPECGGDGCKKCLVKGAGIGWLSLGIWGSLSKEDREYVEKAANDDDEGEAVEVGDKK